MEWAEFSICFVWQCSLVGIDLCGFHFVLDFTNCDVGWRGVFQWLHSLHLLRKNPCWVHPSTWNFISRGFHAFDKLVGTTVICFVFHFYLACYLFLVSRFIFFFSSLLETPLVPSSQNCLSLILLPNLSCQL